jgi:hypothetical protein
MTILPKIANIGQCRGKIAESVEGEFKMIYLIMVINGKNMFQSRKPYEFVQFIQELC